jgi:hypothetical protein
MSREITISTAGVTTATKDGSSVTFIPIQHIAGLSLQGKRLTIYSNNQNLGITWNSETEEQAQLHYYQVSSAIAQANANPETTEQQIERLCMLKRLSVSRDEAEFLVDVLESCPLSGEDHAKQLSVELKQMFGMA